MTLKVLTCSSNSVMPYVLRKKKKVYYHKIIKNKIFYNVH